MTSSPIPSTAVIVTYNPDLAMLGRLIDTCTPQVDRVVLVDNGDGARLKPWLAQRAKAAPAPGPALLALGENKGVAAAQNSGIAWARAKGARQIVLFDHDSDPPPDLVARLQAALADLERTGEKVAAVGPRYVDSRRQGRHPPSPFVRFRAGRMPRCYPQKGSPYVPVDFLIASGSLIPVAALQEIGLMEERLFIDYVDIEWGLRARAKGWSLYGVWDAAMEHSLGDDHIVVLGRAYSVHSPLRHYYMLRNVVWLCLRGNLRWQWRLALAQNGMKKLAAYSMLMPRPWQHFRAMCLGIYHGALGRMGRLRGHIVP